MLINVEMPTIVGILTFMSRINFVLSGVEYEKKFITLGPYPCSNALHAVKLSQLWVHEAFEHEYFISKYTLLKIL